MTGEINKLRQLLCEESTPTLKSKVCAMCLNDMMWDMAENVIPGLKEWADRQQEIAVNLERHSRRCDNDHENYSELRFKMKSLEGADLSGANLHCADLRHSNSEGVDMVHSNLRLANLKRANLSGANLFKSTMFRASLSGANLSGANLTSTNLRDANLRYSNLSNTNLCYSSLEGADLSGANLSDANLSDANLHGARYNADTQFPEGFSPSEHGMVEVKE